MKVILLIGALTVLVSGLIMYSRRRMTYKSFLKYHETAIVLYELDDETEENQFILTSLYNIYLSYFYNFANGDFEIVEEFKKLHQNEEFIEELSKYKTENQ